MGKASGALVAVTSVTDRLVHEQLTAVSEGHGKTAVLADLCRGHGGLPKAEQRRQAGCVRG